MENQSIDNEIHKWCGWNIVWGLEISDMLDVPFDNISTARDVGKGTV